MLLDEKVTRSGSLFYCQLDVNISAVAAMDDDSTKFFALACSICVEGPKSRSFLPAKKKYNLLFGYF